MRAFFAELDQPGLELLGAQRVGHFDGAEHLGGEERQPGVPAGGCSAGRVRPTPRPVRLGSKASTDPRADREVRHDSAMDRSTALQLLTAHKAVLAERFGVVRLALFGSTARNSAKPDSDVDVLVSFDGPATPEAFFGVQFYLEDLLGCEVDLVTERALRPQLKPYVERDAIPIV